ncbi:hypothetical protein Scep_019330 [Stephania cephalantha]|uniref:Uncharacterized protein n=1 Tax=Stephania cephalantha TaxID=152367 RepID=A0AAP0IBL5_9MAGN
MCVSSSMKIFKKKYIVNFCKFTTCPEALSYLSNNSFIGSAFSVVALKKKKLSSVKRR